MRVDGYLINAYRMRSFFLDSFADTKIVRLFTIHTYVDILLRLNYHHPSLITRF
jgi:hypothetical protein